MLDASKEELIEIISQLNEEIYELNEKLHNSSNQNLKSDDDFLETEKKAQEEAHQIEIDKLNSEIQAYQDTIRNLQEQLSINSGFHIQNEFDSESPHESNGFSYQSKASSNDDSYKITFLKNQLLEAHKEISHQTEELNRKNQFFYDEINRLSKEIQNPPNHYFMPQMYTDDVSHLKKECESLKLVKTELSKLLEIEMGERLNLSNRFTEYQRNCSAQISSLVDESSEYYNVYSSLKAMFNSLSSDEIIANVRQLFIENNEKHQTNNESQLISEQLQKEMLRNTELQSQNRELINQIHILQNEKKQNEANQKQMSNEKNNELKQQNTQLIIENEELRNKIRSLLDEKSQISQNNSIYENEKLQLNQTITNLQNEINRLNETIHSKHNENEQLKQNIKEIKDELDKLHDEKNQLVLSLESAEHERDQNLNSSDIKNNSFESSHISDILFEVSQHFASLETQNNLTTAISVLFSSIGSGGDDYQEALENLDKSVQNYSTMVLTLMIKTFDQISNFQTNLEIIFESIAKLSDQIDYVLEKKDLMDQKTKKDNFGGSRIPKIKGNKVRIPLGLKGNAYDSGAFSPRQTPSMINHPKRKHSIPSD